MGGSCNPAPPVNPTVRAAVQWVSKAQQIKENFA
jgi:hypothetical protein